VRHCAACDRQVFSLSDMTEIEAELRLLNSGDEHPCIRYARDEHGAVVHRAAYVPPRSPYQPGRAMVMASALSAGLLAHRAEAKDKPPPTQCVMIAEPDAPRPAPSPPSPAPSNRPAAAPAPAPAPPPPQPTAGVPPPRQDPVAVGTLTVLSKTPRDITVHGLVLKAPLTAFRMTPGNFTIEVAGDKRRTLRIIIKVNQLTTVDLDKP